MQAVENTNHLTRRTALAAAITLCVLAALACNFPVVQPPTHTPQPSLTATLMIDLSDLTIVPPTPITPRTVVVTATPGPSETPQPTLTPTLTETPRPTETLVPTLDAPYTSATYLMRGVCFAYLQGLANQLVSFTSAGSLTDFYNRVNESKKCVEPVSRATFDFNGKQVVGVIIAGQGCSFLLNYERTERDTNAKTQTIVIRASTVGDCPYLLVQPVLFAVETDGANAGFKTQVWVTK